MNRPNVILIFADDLGIGDLSCFNPCSQLRTEHIDALAAQGMRFTDAHATSALCTPSRYGLLTGRYNWRSALKYAAVNGYTRHLIEDGRATLGTLFKRAGYKTAVIGKWHLGLDWDIDEHLTDAYSVSNTGFMRMPVPEIDYAKPVKNGPSAYGFDYSYVTPGSLDIPPYVFLENDRVVEPPLGHSGVDDYPHTRSTVTDPADKRFYTWPGGETSVDYVHKNVVPDSAGRVLDCIEDYAAADDPFFIYYPMHAPHIPCLPTDEFAGKSKIGPYGDMVLMIDDIVGRIMAKLCELGIEDNTIVMFASDNGSENSYPQFGHEPSYIYRGHKGDIWDGGHRIPWILSWPGHVKPGMAASQTVSLTDAYSTFAEILDIALEDDEAEDSFSLSSLLRGDTKQIRDYTVHSSGNGYFAIRKGKWKLEMCPYAGSMADRNVDLASLPPTQLYDMEADPGETNNLVNEHPDIVEELTQLLTDCVFSGRSTAGAKGKNTGPEWWPQINWIKTDRE